MVVVEGVSRSLNPISLDIWDAARPEVESYIKNNLGPRAVLKDLVKTLQSLTHFGHKLPEIIESIIAINTQKNHHVKNYSKLKKLTWSFLGCIFTIFVLFISNFFQ
jgi:ubiquinone biosynthesis protein